jgi:hypothetical protein
MRLFEAEAKFGINFIHILLPVIRIFVNSIFTGLVLKGILIGATVLRSYVFLHYAYAESTLNEFTRIPPLSQRRNVKLGVEFF